MQRILLLAWLCLPVLASASDMSDRLAACAACHGEDGRSADEAYYPSIAGKPAGYLHSQLQHFKAGRRPHRIMADMLTPLSDAYLAEIAAYYAAQQPARQAKQAAPATAEAKLAQQLINRGDPQRNIPACKTCHGATLKGVSPAIPGLLGLRSEYLAAQLGAWRAGVRQASNPDCMGEIAKALSPEEIDALSAWIASRPYPADHRPQARLKQPLPMDCGGLE